MNKNNGLCAGDKIDELLEKLAPHNTNNLPLSTYSFKKINSKTMNYLYEQLKTTPTQITNNVARPNCPAKSFKYANQARAPYKNEMNKYINQWGIKFESSTSIPFNVFEALANYLENKK